MKKFSFITVLLFVLAFSCGFKYDQKSIGYIREPMMLRGQAQLGVKQVLILGEGDSKGTLSVYKDGVITQMADSDVMNISEAIPYMSSKNKFGGTIVADPDASKRIFVGDSITYFLHEHTERDGDISSWFAQAAMGGDWLQNIAMPALSGSNVSGKKIIMALGANDILLTQSCKSWSGDEYAKYYSTDLFKQLTEAGNKIYVSAILPIDPNDINTNKKIDAFNKRLKAGLPDYITFLDSNTYMKKVGIQFIDGLHLTPDSSRKLYTFWATETADEGEQIIVPKPATDNVEIPIDPQVQAYIAKQAAMMAAQNDQTVQNADTAANDQAAENVKTAPSETTVQNTQGAQEVKNSTKVESAQSTQDVSSTVATQNAQAEIADSTANEKVM